MTAVTMYEIGILPVTKMEISNHKEIGNESSGNDESDNNSTGKNDDSTTCDNDNSGEILNPADYIDFYNEFDVTFTCWMIGNKNNITSRSFVAFSMLKAFSLLTPPLWAILDAISHMKANL